MATNETMKKRQEELSRPLFTFDTLISNDFLDEEVDLRHNIGDFYTLADLATMWSNSTMIAALVKYPSVIFDLRLVAKKYDVRIEPVRIKDSLKLLKVTKDYLWEMGIETIEELFTGFVDIDDDIIRQDIASAFLSKFGVNLLNRNSNVNKSAS